MILLFDLFSFIITNRVDTTLMGDHFQKSQVNRTFFERPPVLQEHLWLVERMFARQIPLVLVQVHLQINLSHNFGVIPML